ncbi:ATP-binding protein [Casimicrobium huifangae]|uniref:ATP-binding protein n=1 Tax=Casimicrobium huifangae TaxID=2591109 RepID=UPI0013969361|nr:ATP-binding protein [Casimicrobium huifangae]
MTAAEASSFCRRLFDHRFSETLSIDFSELAFVIPQGTMCLFIGVTKVIAERRNLGLSSLTLLIPTPRTDAVAYLMYMDFFEHLALPSQTTTYAKLPPDRKYIKMSCVHLQREEFLVSASTFHRRLDDQAQSFAEFLLQRSSTDDAAVQAVGWCLREAVRNVFEHAQVDRAYVTGQAWKNGQVELSVGDAGVGICESLAASHQPKDACDALRLAVQPGITDYQGPETDDDWQNSGFGLYMLRRIAGDFGSLTLVSGGAFLKVETQGEEHLLRPTGSRFGTTLALSLKIPSDIYFPNLLERYKNEGEDQALSVPGARHVASRASTRLW